VLNNVENFIVCKFCANFTNAQSQ